VAEEEQIAQFEAQFDDKNEKVESPDIDKAVRGHDCTVPEVVSEVVPEVVPEVVSGVVPEVVPEVSTGIAKA